MLPHIGKQVIKNINSKVCAQCIYSLNNSANDVLKCSLFGQKNIVTGEIHYDSCYTARKDVMMCGQDALYYKASRPELGETVPTNDKPIV